MKATGKYLQPPSSTLANLPTLTTTEVGAELSCSDYFGGATTLVWTGTAWIPRTNRPTRIVTVDQGGRGDFTTITAAFAYIASLTGGAIPTATSRYLVQAGAGTFTESFTVPPYVGFKGQGRKVTTIIGLITVNGDTNISSFSVNNVNNGIYESILFDFSTPAGSTRTYCTDVTSVADYAPSGVNQVVAAFAVLATVSSAVHIADMQNCWGYARNRVAAGSSAFAAAFHWKTGSLYGQFEISHCSGKTSMNSPGKSAFARNSESAFSSSSGGFFMGSNAYYAVNDTSPFMTYNASSDQYVMNNSNMSFYGDVSIPNQSFTNFGAATNASMPLTFDRLTISVLPTGLGAGGNGRVVLCTDLTGGENLVRWDGAAWTRVVPHLMRETITPSTVAANTALGTASRAVKDPKMATLYDGIPLFSFSLATIYPIGWGGTGNKTLTWKPTGFTGDAADVLVSTPYMIEYSTLEVF